MGMIRIAVAAISLLCVLGRVAAAEWPAPRIMRAEVDWERAVQKLGEVAPLRAVHASAAAGVGGREIDRLNAAVADRLPGIASSPVPVLLPFDVDAYLRDRTANVPAEGDPPPDPADKYFAGFGQPAFFAPGPAGYDATFRIAVAAIPALADIRFREAADVSISGSLLTYELDPPIAAAGAEVPALEAEFPGIRRFFVENRVRYAFVRFGVPYVVSIDCFDAGFARYHHMACRDADRVIEHFLQALRIAGGAPQPAAPPAAAPAIERPADLSPTFTYHAPGRLIARTGFRGHTGRADGTVYSAIRFPLAATPAFANTQYYQRRVAGGVAAYPWRDNFCEGRSYSVAQCPAGMGHQGQDIRAADCSRTSTGDDRCGEHHDDVVAVRDGTILRARGQEAAYLIVNTPTEHIRFRYLHMRPKLLDAAGVVSGRRVAEGEVLGRIGNFSHHENGTSYHVHFDIQVPTRAGWVYVSPYMTLVSAYERLIGARGSEISDVVAGAGGGALTLAAIHQAILGGGTPAPAIASRPQVAAACGARGLRVRHWRGCAVARIGHGAPAASAGEIKAAPPHVGEAGAAPAVKGAQIVRHGHAARAAVLTHRTFRRHRS
jgi:murein DD-endopeptidase MepM/ murein hydrolase activator NlpD